MTSAGRWSLAALILVVAAVVAIWPRDGRDGAGDSAADPANTGNTVTGPDGPDLAAARSAAALTPCAAGSFDGRSGRTEPIDGSDVAELSGVRVECLADGSGVDLADELAGRTVLVNIWATWCQPCREELPVLADYAAGQDAVDVLGVAVQSERADALTLLADIGVRLPTVFDATGAVERALAAPDALPASYLVGADGSVRLVTDPRLFRSVADVRSAVTAWQGESGRR